MDFSFLTQTFNQNKQQPYQPTIAAETNTKSLRINPKHISYNTSCSYTYLLYSEHFRMSYSMYKKHTRIFHTLTGQKSGHLRNISPGAFVIITSNGVFLFDNLYFISTFLFVCHMKKSACLSPALVAGRVEAGCDEAGRGCLAGAVFAAAVILPTDFSCPELNDSKQLSDRQRYALRPLIEQSAIAWAVGAVSPQEIDQINILNASFLAMHRAIKQLGTLPQHLLIDGNRFNAYPGIGHTCIIKGDGKFLSIAAASILAKTYRDDYMNRLHAQFPVYGWDKNKGYPTRAHREAIKQYGASPFHRMSFQLVERQLSLF